MPSNACSITLRPRDTSAGDIAREWLVRFAEVCQREITPALTHIWVEALREVYPDQLERACKQLLRMWTTNFLPTPGNVIAQLDGAESKGVDLRAEKEWRTALRIATRFYHPQIGVYSSVPKDALSPVGWHALRSVPGGLSRLFNCAEEDLQWAKKQFLAAFTLAHDTGKVEHLLSDGEAKAILANIRETAPKLFAAPAREEPDPNPPGHDEVRRALRRVLQPTAEEIAARVRRIQETAAEIDALSVADAEEYKRKYGLLSPGQKGPTSQSAVAADFPHVPPVPYTANQPNVLSAEETA